jgi:hypothetical protein
VGVPTDSNLDVMVLSERKMFGKLEAKPRKKAAPRTRG